MLKNVICIFLVCLLILSVIYLCNLGTVEHYIFASATVENVSIREGSVENPIIPNEENHIENFMKVSGLSEEDTMDIINNPENYLYIVCLVKIENKGDVKLLLKEPSVNMFEEHDIWLLNEIEGYQELAPNAAEKTSIFLVAKNTTDNKNFSTSIPMTVEYNEKIAFKKIRNSIIVWTK